MRSSFEDLVAYRLAVELADEVYLLVQRWPPLQQWSVGMQLIRALDSIGANIAEGCGRWHRADQRRLLVVARGSLFEAEHWIARAEVRDLLPAESRSRLDEIARSLSGLIKKRAAPG